MGKEEKLLELRKKAEVLKGEIDYYNALQNALKLVLNGSYGAFTTKYFVLFNQYIGASITAQGRELTRLMDKVNEDYWYNQWHLDTETHKKLFIKNVKAFQKATDPVSIYADTDSVSSDSIIQTDRGKFTIEDLYIACLNYGSAGNTVKGHESMNCPFGILNYKDGDLEYTNAKRIIRHKVSKSKWKLKTKSGKEVIVTNDHSMIVFRDGVQLEVKPSEILKTDKILVVN
jgi:hypothetical protein